MVYFLGMEKTAIQKACEAAGNQASLARMLGISETAVGKWVKRGFPPAERVLAIEEAVGGKVTRHELRPDIYPLSEEDAA